MSAWEAPGASDEWYTPPEVFEALGCSFDLDVAAPWGQTHVPAGLTYNKAHNGLAQPWRGFVWMNPPFGKRGALAPWLDKFFAHGDGIALTPDRTSAPWFQAAWARADRVLFARHKIKFVRPDGSRGKQPGTGTALWAIGRDGCNALDRAAACGFGILAEPISRLSHPAPSAVSRRGCV